MPKKRPMPDFKRSAGKIIVIQGPDGPTHTYGEDRKCEECRSPLSQYNPATICSLCQNKISKKGVLDIVVEQGLARIFGQK